MKNWLPNYAMNEAVGILSDFGLVNLSISTTRRTSTCPLGFQMSHDFETTRRMPMDTVRTGEMSRGVRIEKLTSCSIMLQWAMRS